MIYEYALETERKIHEINPELRLGILAFEDDSWFHLSILRGFSAGEPDVMAWHEDTYSGYKKGKIDRNHEVFALLGIEGKVVPGMWSLWRSTTTDSPCMRQIIPAGMLPRWDPQRM